MRSDVADLKQKLEDGDVECYCWTQGEEIIADLLTKEMKSKFGFEELLRDNRLRCIMLQDNCVSFEKGEFLMKGRRLKEKLIAKAKKPMLRPARVGRV